MSSTSDQMTQPSKKTRLIIDEIGVDTETGIIGKGHSYDNGKTFVVDDTIYGRIYHKDDHGRIWKGIQDKVEKVVKPAIDSANSAQSAADAAVASAQVTSDAVIAIASATAEAKQGANEAMSRAKSAWDVAIGAKSAVTDFDPLLKSAQSDAGKALTQIADTASALSDAKTSFGSDVAEAKKLANTAQTTASNAVESASSVANDLANVASQAKSNANGITKVTSDVGLLQTTVADNSGNISKIQETASQIQQAVSDNAGNITVAKQTAESTVTVASDARSNATVAIQTASQASVTAKDASGQAASAVLTANGAMTTASDAKSDATVAVQTASGASLTATNANSDATIAKQTASEAIVQASNAESNFAQLSIRAGQIEANVANNSGAIASVQQTANGLTTTVSNIKANGGGVNLLVGTSTASGDVANGNGTFVKGAFNGYDAVKTNGAWSERFIDLKSALGRMNAKAGDWYIISVYVKADKQINDGSLGVYRALGNVDANTNDGFLDGIPMQNKPITTQWQQYSWSFQINDISLQRQVTRVEYSQDTGDNWIYWAGWMLEKGVVTHDWSPAIDDFQNQFTQIKTSIDGVTTTINDPKTGLNATYQTAAGNASTISNVKGDVTQLQTTATGLTSRVGNLESKTNTQQTAIEQNKNAITLKADQTDVDTVKGTVTGLQSSLTVQGNQIQAKVSASDVSGMLAGYATQSYAQSLVTQKADQWNLNLTSLQTDVNAIKTTGGGRNLIANTGTDIVIDATSNVANNWAFVVLNFTEQPKHGDLITVSAEGTLTGTGTLDEYQVVLYNASTTNSRSQAQYLKAGKRDSVTLSLDNLDGDGDTVLLIYAGKASETGGKKNVIHHLMVEKGTVAHDWSPAPSDMATVTSVTNLSATVDGIKSTVATKADQSTVTQLSNLVQSKVSSGDFTSTTTQLKNLINQRVQVGDVISQINQEAGGNTLIQVSNGKGSLILDAGNTIITGKAWIPSAAIANLTADQVQAGTLSGSKVHAGDNSGNAIDMGALSAGYVGFHAYANNGDNTYIDYNGIHNYGASYDTRIQQGKITTNYLTVNGGGMIDFRDSNGTGMVAQGSTLTFDVGNTPAGYLSYNGMPVAEIPDGSGGNELAIRYGLSAAIIPNDNSGAQATFSGAAQKIGYMTGTNQGKQMLSGLEVHSNNHHWFGAVNSDATWNRIEINSNDGVNLAWHDQTHFWISDGKAKLYKDNNDSQTATELEVHGWAWVNGWVEAAGHSQHSTLSSKTRIEEADPDYMLDLVNNTDLTTFAFKSEVAEGLVVRHIGPIIDDVNDVAQYRTPAEFIAPTKTARDDDNMIGALFGAVQALTKRIKKLEDKLNG